MPTLPSRRSLARAVLRVAAVLCLLLAAIVLGADYGEYSQLSRAGMRALAFGTLPLLLAGVLGLFVLDGGSAHRWAAMGGALAAGVGLLRQALLMLAHGGAPPIAWMLAVVGLLLVAGVVGVSLPARPTLGLESGRVRVVPYDAAWPALYEAEAARVARHFAEAGIRVELEHMGSTAVPGLAAKPIVDILGGLAAERDRLAAIAALGNAGYDHRGEQGIPGRDFFRRGDPRQYHLHLALVDSVFWRDHRLFRDWLRAHPEAAAAYAALKLDLARRFPRDREAYIDGKASFVASVLAMARPRREADDAE